LGVAMGALGYARLLLFVSLPYSCVFLQNVDLHHTLSLHLSFHTQINNHIYSYTCYVILLFDSILKQLSTDTQAYAECHLAGDESDR
jgi:hypothetical protein